MNVINKPCGHSYAVWCDCAGPSRYTWTTARIQNGMCFCRGPFDAHPFHQGSVTSAGYLTTEVDDGYIGKHRKP